MTTIKIKKGIAKEVKKRIRSAESVVKEFETNNNVSLTKCHTDKITIVYPSIGEMYLKKGYQRKKLIENIGVLVGELRSAGYNAKFLDQKFLLSAGIVQGGFGIGWMNRR